METYEFPIQKRGIFYKFKEIKVLGGDVLKYVAQLTPQIDDEIVKPGTHNEGVGLRQAKRRQRKRGVSGWKLTKACFI